MAKERIIPVNNADFLHIQANEDGSIFVERLDKHGKRDLVEDSSYNISKEDAAKLWTDYINGLIPADFLPLELDKKEPFIKSKEGHVVMLLNYYRWKHQ